MDQCDADIITRNEARILELRSNLAYNEKFQKDAVEVAPGGTLERNAKELRRQIAQLEQVNADIRAKYGSTVGETNEIRARRELNRKHIE